MSEAIRKRNKKFLGHVHVFTGYQGSYPYLTAKKGPIDNIKRHHVNLYGRCDICDKEILLAHIHIDSETDKMNFKEK